MTEHTTTDCLLCLLGLVVFVLGAVGRRLGWPVLTSLADWLANFAGKKAEPQPEAEKKPAVQETASLKSYVEKVEAEPHVPQVLVAHVEGRQYVALPLWLTYLLPILLQALQRLLDMLKEKYGREATREERLAAAEKVWKDYQDGRLRVYPVADAVALPDGDLEKTTGGKDVRAEALAAARKLGSAAEETQALAGEARRLIR